MNSAYIRPCIAFSGCDGILDLMKRVSLAMKRMGATPKDIFSLKSEMLNAENEKVALWIASKYVDFD